jgi:hypothetical protein
MGTRIGMAEHYAGCQKPLVFIFSVSQCTSDVIVVPCCMNSTISTPVLAQKTVDNSFLARRQRLFKLFGWFGGCMCIYCFHCSLVSTFTNETQVSSPVTRTM